MNFIAVDSGGTQSFAVVFNQEGIILAQERGGSGNARLSDNNTALNNILTVVESAIKQVKGFCKIERAYLFIPGFKDCLDEFVKRTGIESEIRSEDDELFYSAFGGDDGIVVLSGTGSFATAFYKGKRYSVGGWGNVFGDEGSGYDIGAQTLRQCAVDTDECRQTELTQAVCEYLGLDDFAKGRSIYKRSNLRETIAGVCKITCDLAAKGNLQARAIVDEAVLNLTTLAQRAYVKSGADQRLNVTLCGGLSKSTYFTKAFEERIAQMDRLKFVLPKYDIIGGAIASILAQIK